eukprot:177676-Prorocentrum_minimum.AAC.1
MPASRTERSSKGRGHTIPAARTNRRREGGMHPRRRPIEREEGGIYLIAQLRVPLLRALHYRLQLLPD